MRPFSRFKSSCRLDWTLPTSSYIARALMLHTYHKPRVDAYLEPAHQFFHSLPQCLQHSLELSLMPSNQLTEFSLLSASKEVFSSNTSLLLTACSSLNILTSIKSWDMIGSLRSLDHHHDLPGHVEITQIFLLG